MLIDGQSYSEILNGELYTEFVKGGRIFGETRLTSVLADDAATSDTAYHRYVSRIAEVCSRIEAMPKVYGTEHISADDKIAVLRYYVPDPTRSMESYIIERDFLKGEQKGDNLGQIQAWGFNDFGQGMEMGYINIRELLEYGFSLDLDFEPKTMREIRDEKENKKLQKLKEVEECRFPCASWW
ncbi:hypothetical protein [Acinetobacter brisouii]|uniref:hypothetical protein n=1 Tax=Acinetobacter brisouii TaxID=396323 RepID=UPI00124C4A6B|nr:hypothetical protein [Acinetobacter brisouii]